MSEFQFPYRSQSGYGTGPDDEAAIERLSRAVQHVELVVLQPKRHRVKSNVLLERGQIASDVVLNLGDWR